MQLMKADSVSSLECPYVYLKFAFCFAANNAYNENINTPICKTS